MPHTTTSSILLGDFIEFNTPKPDRKRIDAIIEMASKMVSKLPPAKLGVDPLMASTTYSSMQFRWYSRGDLPMPPDPSPDYQYRIPSSLVAVLPTIPYGIVHEDPEPVGLLWKLLRED